jgi:hypothetical protein
VLDSLNFTTLVVNRRLFVLKSRSRLIGYTHVLVVLRGHVSGSIGGSGGLRTLEKAIRVVDGEPTSCELIQLLALGRVRFRGLAVLA